MQDFSLYILEKLKIDKNIKVNSKDKILADEYYAVYIGDANIKLMEEIERNYKLNQVYCAFNDCYIYLIPVNDIKKYKSKNNRLSIYRLNEFNTLKEFIEKCNSGKVDFDELEEI